MTCQHDQGSDGGPESEPRPLTLRPVLSTNVTCTLMVGLAEGGGLQAGRNGVHVPLPGGPSENSEEDVPLSLGASGLGGTLSWE